MLKAQYIIAGQHSSNDYYILKDTSFASPNSWGIDTVRCYIDINGDGIYDYRINISTDNGASHSIDNVIITPLNNNQVVKGLNDTCRDTSGHFVSSYPMLLSINKGDTINRYYNWKGNSLYFSYILFFVPADPNCSGMFSGTDTSIIGVRIFNTKDTLYGWIRIKGLTNSGMTVIDYACQKQNAGINQLNTSNNIIVYPNPSKGVFNFQLPVADSQSTVEVYNVLGEEVYKAAMPQALNGGIISIDMSYYSAGMYFYRIVSANASSIAIGKLVIL
jgi:hypothetical protein